MQRIIEYPNLFQIIHQTQKLCQKNSKELKVQIKDRIFAQQKYIRKELTFLSNNSIYL